MCKTDPIWGVIILVGDVSILTMAGVSLSCPNFGLFVGSPTIAQNMFATPTCVPRGGAGPLGKQKRGCLHDGLPRKSTSPELDRFPP